MSAAWPTDAPGQKPWATLFRPYRDWLRWMLNDRRWRISNIAERLSVLLNCIEAVLGADPSAANEPEKGWLPVEWARSTGNLVALVRFLRVAGKRDPAGTAIAPAILPRDGREWKSAAANRFSAARTACENRGGSLNCSLQTGGRSEIP